MIVPGFPDAQPIEGLLGGVLIGLAASIMLLFLGRIAGVSGLAARTAGLGGSGIERSGAVMFIIGLPIGAMAVALITGGADIRFPSPIFLVIAGVLVGIGTRLGSGCTSGHGVCGISRLSARSIVATITFMASGIATVAVMNALGLEVLP